MNLEVIKRAPQDYAAGTTGCEICGTPILFVHGVWHAAWCWDEHFLPYFAEKGFTAYALSLRHHGKSQSTGSIRWIRGAEYVEDVAQVVEMIGQTPVLIGHSMGGYIVQKYLERPLSGRLYYWQRCPHTRLGCKPAGDALASAGFPQGQPADEALAYSG